MNKTKENLWAAFAGESQAHTKYRYFAKVAREAGYESVARHFEHTADQELVHSWGHLELLIGKPTVQECLMLAVDGETYEFTTMYPDFERQAQLDGDAQAAQEARDQADESKTHAESFQQILKAQKRFAALKRVEQKHAQAYQKLKESL